MLKNKVFIERDGKDIELTEWELKNAYLAWKRHLLLEDAKNAFLGYYNGLPVPKASCEEMFGYSIANILTANCCPFLEQISEEYEALLSAKSTDMDDLWSDAAYTVLTERRNEWALETLGNTVAAECKQVFVDHGFSKDVADYLACQDGRMMIITMAEKGWELTGTNIHGECVTIGLYPNEGMDIITRRKNGKTQIIQFDCMGACDSESYGKDWKSISQEEDNLPWHRQIPNEMSEQFGTVAGRKALYKAYGSKGGTFAGKNQDNEVVILTFTKEGIKATCFQSNGWIRSNYYDPQGLMIEEIIEGRDDKE